MLPRPVMATQGVVGLVATPHRSEGREAYTGAELAGAGQVGIELLLRLVQLGEIPVLRL